MSDPNRSALLRVRDLSVRFSTPRGELLALDKVSLDVPASSTLAIVGESGSGKSVLSRSILRLLPSTATVDAASSIRFGEIDVFAQTPAELRRLRGRRIAMVFQDPMTALNPVRRIGAQLTEGLRVHMGLSAQAATARAIELVDQVGISSARQRLDQYPHELSGGMRQRIVIAMAIACEPELLIADEPTTALDVTVQAEIMALLTRLKRERRMTMILVTHDLGLAAEHADRIAVMYAGQVVEQSDTATIFDRQRMPYTRALLRSIPRLDDAPHRHLQTIPGRPPSVVGLQPGCRFALRCERVQGRCRVEVPPLSAAPGGLSAVEHCYRCWFPIDVRPERLAGAAT
jgi:peptide/nickel transport system ATP-binding protein